MSSVRPTMSSLPAAVSSVSSVGRVVDLLWCLFRAADRASAIGSIAACAVVKVAPRSGFWSVPSGSSLRRVMSSVWSAKVVVGLPVVS